jgi:hypothetical protein
MVRGLHGIYFFASVQIASVGCMCSIIVHFLHCICVCDCDGCHKSLIMLSRSVMVRRSHLLARCYLGTMCMCTTCPKVSALLCHHHTLENVEQLCLETYELPPYTIVCRHETYPFVRQNTLSRTRF